MNLLDNFRANVMRIMTERKISARKLATDMNRNYRQTYEILYAKKDLYLRDVELVCMALGVDPIAMMEE